MLNTKEEKKDRRSNLCPKTLRFLSYVKIGIEDIGVTPYYLIESVLRKCNGTYP